MSWETQARKCLPGLTEGVFNLKNPKHRGGGWLPGVPWEGLRGPGFPTSLSRAVRAGGSLATHVQFLQLPSILPGAVNSIEHPGCGMDVCAVWEADGRERKKLEPAAVLSSTREQRTVRGSGSAGFLFNP